MSPEEFMNAPGPTRRAAATGPVMSPEAFMSATPRGLQGNSDWASRYARELHGLIVRQAQQAPRSLQVHLGPSELGAVCDHQIVAKLIGAPRTNHVSDPWPSVVGTSVHAWLATACEDDNRRDKTLRWLTEQAVEPAPGYGGHADLYDAQEQAVVDWKGISISTPVATPDGWTAAGMLDIGDTVFGADGHPCRVTRIYSAQLRQCYRILFDDGSDLVTDDVQELPFVIAGKIPRLMTMSIAVAINHIWSKSPRPQRQLRLYNGGSFNLPQRDLIVHPYVLGCWLGDGGVHGGTIGKPDDELFDHIRSCGYEVGEPMGQRKMSRTVYGLSNQLQRLGLQWRDPEHPHSHGRLAGVKRIPDEYLRASRYQRLALLQGLMDTDGTWNQPRKRAVFTTTDKGLAEAAAELIATLGWKAHISPQKSTGFGITVTEYYVEFTPIGKNPFRLSRKADLAASRLEGSARSAYRIVKSIEPVPSVLTRCIDVDSPDHLYLAGEQMIPVHNCLGATSLNKIKSPAGPPRRYVVQLLLYARGYRNLGLPVKRVAIAALPRTASTLDMMFVWSRDCGPEDDILVDDVLDQMAARQAAARMIRNGQLSLNQVKITPDPTECFFCLAGETEVVTREGIKPIAELVGTSPELLVPRLSPSGQRQRTGSFQRAPVNYFGEQPTYRIILEDRRVSREIIATAEHRWFVTDRTRTRVTSSGARTVRHQCHKITTALQPGDLLQPLRRAVAAEPDMMDVAVAQGFIFGGGTVGQNQRPATLAVYDNGKKNVMLRFFPAFKKYDGVKHIYGLPRFWKELPPLAESRPFLLSWLAGYFAADGHVTENGQCSIASADKANLLFVRDLAAVCGVGYRPVQTASRVGIGATGSSTDLFQIALQRRDLPTWFFLLDEHRIRAEAANEKPDRESYWKVVSVEPTGRAERVYCATVENAAAFGLEGDLMTGNCGQYRPSAAYDNGPGCPGTVTRRA